MDSGHAPPPPPPLGGGEAGAQGQAIELPPHLQAMMREVQATFGAQQQYNDQQLPLQFGRSTGRGTGGRGNEPRMDNISMYGGGYHGRGGGGHRRGRGGRGGRGNQRGRGRGARGRFGEQNDQDHYGPQKRKRDFDGAVRFFLPSFLEDPWLPLLRPNSAAMTPTSFPASSRQTSNEPHEVMRDTIQQRPGRVLFQPTFLDDPWATLLR